MKQCCKDYLMEQFERKRFGALNETIYHIPAENREKQ